MPDPGRKARIIAVNNRGDVRPWQKHSTFRAFQDIAGVNHNGAVKHNTSRGRFGRQELDGVASSDVQA